MNIRDFPTSVRPDKCFPYTEEPAVSAIEYEDNSQDYNLDSICGRQFFKLTFLSIEPADADTLDAHYNEAQGEANTFRFTDPFTGFIYADVRYAEYEHGKHVKSWSPIRQILLVQELA